MNDVLSAIGVMFILFIVLLIELFKYNDFKFKKVLYIVKDSSLLVKLIVSILIVFSIAFPVAYSKSPLNLPSIGYNSSEFNKVIDVGDGLVAVGRTKKSISDPQNQSHFYSCSRAYIVKYSYDGDIIWEHVKYKEDNVEVRSSYSNVYINNDGNFVAKGTFGDYYDGYILAEVIYSKEGVVLNTEMTYYEDNLLTPSTLSDSQQILFDYSIDNDDHQTMMLNLEYFDYENRLHIVKDVELIFNAESLIRSGDLAINVIYYDDEKIVLGVVQFPFFEDDSYNKIITLNYAMDVLNITDLPANIIPGRIIESNGNLYMLSSNGKIRKSNLVTLDEDFMVEDIYPIETNLDYFVARDIVIDDSNIYIAGNEYETVSKEGFVEYFSGIIKVFNLDMELEETNNLRQGVGVNSMVIVNGDIYTVGLFNTSIGLPLSSLKYNLPWCGVISRFNNNNVNYILGFIE